MTSKSLISCRRIQGPALSLWPSRLHIRGGIGLEGLEVVHEHSGQLACLLGVRALVFPCVARVQNLCRHTWHSLRHFQVESGIR